MQSHLPPRSVGAEQKGEVEGLFSGYDRRELAMDCGCGSESSRRPEDETLWQSSGRFPRNKKRIVRNPAQVRIEKRPTWPKLPSSLSFCIGPCLMESMQERLAQPGEAIAPENESVSSSPPQPSSEEPDAAEESLESVCDQHSNSCSASGAIDNLQSLLSKNKVAVYWHPACQLHDIPDHPEQPRRIEHILNALRQALSSEVSFRQASLPSMEIVELYHTKSMVEKFTRLWKETQDAYLKSKKVVYRSIDGDTTIMHTTREAALRAVGSLIDAIDHMFLPASSKLFVDSAFCCIRPPGHHAETNRACGFCFFNNVAIAARYAQSKYGVSKVAILDFDVHHGNGTEEGFENDASVFYASTHELYNFPGTGKDPSPLVGDKALRERDRRIVDRYLHSGSESRAEFKTKWAEILQEMERFGPQLIILSTGFDAHDDDPLSDIELSDEDYYWVTRQILLSALRLSAQPGCKNKVKVVSALEGGYDLNAIARSAVWHVRALREGFAGVAEEYLPSAQESEAEKPSGFDGDEAAALQAELEKMGLLDRT